MGKKQKQLIVRVLVMLVPTYSVAYISEAMIYTMPMLAVCTLIAANLYGEEETEIRVRQKKLFGSMMGQIIITIHGNFKEI
jgi:hypothetical protein